MKICVINTLYKPQKKGGAEIVSSKLVDELKKRGHDVFVVSTGYEDDMDTVEGVKTYRIESGNIFNFMDIDKKPFFLRAIFHIVDQLQTTTKSKMSEILDVEKPDIVLSHNIKGLGYKILQACTEKNVKLVHTLHDIQYAIPSGLMYWGKEKDFLMKNPYNWIYKQINKVVLYHLDRIVSPSQWLVDFYLKQGMFKHQHVEVVRNPITLENPYIEKPCVPTFCSIGQIEEHKGIRLLLESFEIFHDKHPEAKLLIAGTGSLLEDLKKNYPYDWVEFMGYVPYDELPIRVFSKSSFAVMTSLVYENSPGAVYDAFANSTPVVVANIGGSAELVTQGETGYVFEPGNHKSLLEALEKAYKSRDTYSWMGMKARTQIGQYSFDSYIKQILGE